MRADGYRVSTSTVERALRRRGLLLPVGFRADRRSWSRLRKWVFRDPPRERNRVSSRSPTSQGSGQPAHGLQHLRAVDDTKVMEHVGMGES